MKKMYSAKLIKDTFRVGGNNYRAVEMFEEDGEKIYALQDIRNGGTTLIAVSMKEIMDFIGENYELVTAVATYETALSEYARYILPQTVDMWEGNWRKFFQEETQEWGKVVDNQAKHIEENDSFYVTQAKSELSALKYVNNKINEVFEEFKRMKDVLFREDLAEKSFEEILKLLPDYKLKYGEAIKFINENEYFMISETEFDQNDGVEYAVDEGYKTYFKVSYHFENELGAILSLNLEQRHHFFYSEWEY
ncbi:hypothetical protein ASG65_20775 [Bacillus sp. Leaf13]|nr:hypothetical protein ASG65_20775 [Bacillus sp. Leaf13]